MELINNFYFKTICSEETKDALNDQKIKSKEQELQKVIDQKEDEVKEANQRAIDIKSEIEKLQKD